MTQQDLDTAVATATGESLSEIHHRGRRGLHFRAVLGVKALLLALRFGGMINGGANFASTVFWELRAN
jgi:hypothetical protein